MEKNKKIVVGNMKMNLTAEENDLILYKNARRLFFN